MTMKLTFPPAHSFNSFLMKSQTQQKLKKTIPTNIRYPNFNRSFRGWVRNSVRTTNGISVLYHTASNTKNRIFSFQRWYKNTRNLEKKNSSPQITFIKHAKSKTSKVAKLFIWLMYFFFAFLVERIIYHFKKTKK